MGDVLVLEERVAALEQERHGLLFTLPRAVKVRVPTKNGPRGLWHPLAFYSLPGIPDEEKLIGEKLAVLPVLPLSVVERDEARRAMFDLYDRTDGKLRTFGLWGYEKKYQLNGTPSYAGPSLAFFTVGRFREEGVVFPQEESGLCRLDELKRLKNWLALKQVMGEEKKRIDKTYGLVGIARR